MLNRLLESCGRVTRVCVIARACADMRVLGIAEAWQPSFNGKPQAYEFPKKSPPPTACR